MAKRKPGNPNWVKGKSPSPGGKPGKYRLMLEKALAADTKRHGTSLLVHAVKVARKDSTVLNAILKKILPDLKSIEAKLDTESPFRLILEYAPTAKTHKTDKQGKQRPVSSIKTATELSRDRAACNSNRDVYDGSKPPPKTDKPGRPGSGNGRIHSR